MSGAVPPGPEVSRVPRGRRRAAGQGLVEFGLVIGIAAVVAVAVLVLFRPQLAWVLSLIGSEVEKAGQLLAASAFA
jgi:Flp pilus assembly pilin Flp